MLKRLYDKSKLWFAIAWIIAYCVLMSAGDYLSDLIGIEKSATLVAGVLLSAALLTFLKKNGLNGQYGICAPEISARAMLYYVPVIAMLSLNLTYGFALNYGLTESILYVLSMLCVGLLEEVIFRGLLFNAMKENGLRAAIVVSSITFGIGHIINLINGSGADLVSNLLQVVYATAAGFMFVMIYHRSKSLLVCIASHGIFNALSAFSAEASATQGLRILNAVLLTVITAAYAIYLAISAKPKKNGHSV